MKYSLIVLTILSLSACQVHQNPNNIEKTMVLEKQETNTQEIPEIVSPKEKENIKTTSNENSSEDSTDSDLNAWKHFPWKQEIAAKKDKNILDYFYFAPTKLFCDSYVVSEEDYETELKNHPESRESILVENMKGIEKRITKRNIANDYILADMPVGSELQFARFQNTKDGKDIFIAVANRGAGDMCNQFDIWEWDENKGWNTIKEENILPQKEIEKFWEGRSELKEDTIDSYILPEFGTTIKVYGAPFDESEEPTFSYSLEWNGEKFTFK